MITTHYEVLLILGVSAFLGMFGAWFFQKLKMPQVVGYVITGLFLGLSGIKLIDAKHIETLRPFTFFALGIIGFLVGGELKVSEFKKYGKQFMIILLGEGIASFVLVGLGTGGLIYYFNGNIASAIAGGIVLGAISSATDPASTIDVLWEYRSKGIVTTAIIAIIALDDALAMTLYSIGKSVSTMIAGGAMDLKKEFLSVGREIGGSIVLALIFAYILKIILVKIPKKEKALAISLSTLFLVIGMSVTLHLDVILASMTLGFGIANFLPKRSEEMFHTIRSFSIPIYVLFFVLVGARFDIYKIPNLVWWIAIVYIIGRSIGKSRGTWVGAKLSKADVKIQKYAGLGLFAQGGVAIGLAIVAGQNLQGIMLTSQISLGDCIIAVVTATTIAVQLVGPILTKMAVCYAKEQGKNITDEDIMQELSLKEVIYIDEKPLKENDVVNTIIERFTSDSKELKLVKDNNGKFLGVVSFNSLRDLLGQRDLWSWIIAGDIMDQTYSRISSDTSLEDAVSFMNSTNQDVILVKEKDDSEMISGILDIREIKGIIHKKLIDLTV